MSNGSEQNGITAHLAAVDLPARWHYDPGWTWDEVEAAVYHDSLLEVLDGDLEMSYVIEVYPDEIVLRRVCRGDQNRVIESGDRSTLVDSLERVLELGEEQLSKQ